MPEPTGDTDLPESSPVTFETRSINCLHCNREFMTAIPLGSYPVSSNCPWCQGAYQIRDAVSDPDFGPILGANVLTPELLSQAIERVMFYGSTAVGGGGGFIPLAARGRPHTEPFKDEPDQ